MADATRIQIAAELERKMEDAIARYPTEHRRSAAMPLLHLWQEHFGFISDEATFWIAQKLGLQPINILELITFYPMFRQHPAGKTHIRICRTLSCAMAGGFELMENLCASLEIQRSSDGEEMHNPIARILWNTGWSIRISGARVGVATSIVTCATAVTNN